MGKLRDVDSAEVAFRTRAGAYAILIGLVSIAIGVAAAGAFGFPIVAGIAGGIGAGAATYFIVMFISERAGGAAASLYRPSGSSTPALREYSFADSLVARDMIPAAVAEYERLSIEHPDDPEPLLRRARVQRDYQKAYADAALTFRRALAVETLKPETELATLRELVELYVHRQRDPQPALPYLARIAEKFSGTPAADWARAELREIKQSMLLNHE
jgi:hypothetical protein